jgi:hypothetical protein
MPPTYGENAEKIYRMKPRTDDVWLLTFPKCGKFKHKLFDGIRLLQTAIVFNRDHWSCYGYWKMIAILK